MAVKVHRTYEWSEWCDAAKAGPTGTPARETSKHKDSWAGGSWKSAYEMATDTGYAEALPEADAIASHVASDVLTDRLVTTFDARYDVAGSEVDIARFLSGEPECMVESVPLKIARRGRAVRIAVPVCYAASVDADLVRRRGAAVMALVDCLARAQHPLEVWAVMAITGRDDKDRLVYSIRVQAANEPLDMGRVMYALAHPTMLRRLAFSVEDQEKDEKVRTAFSVGSGYGRPPYKAVDGDLPDEDGTTIILPELDYRTADTWRDDAHVEAWITEQLSLIFD